MVKHPHQSLLTLHFTMHIKEKSVMKACWTDMPCNCWGECGIDLQDYSVAY